MQSGSNSSRAHQPRFLAADDGHRRRIATGSALMVGIGSHALTAAAHLPAVHHGARRLWAKATALFLGLDLRLGGMEHIDPGQQYIVVSLHEGLADAVVLLHLPLRLRFTVRDELLGWDRLGLYLAASDQVILATHPNIAQLRRFYRDAAAAVESGDSLVVFPQGSILGIEIAFQQGAFRLARRFGLPVLPVVVTGSHRVWEHPYSPVVRIGERVDVTVLEPIAAGDLTPGMVRELESRMKRIALDSPSAPRRFAPERDGWWDDYPYEIDPAFTDLARRVADRRGQVTGAPR